MYRRRAASNNAVIAGQLKNYQAALSRLTSATDATIGF